MTNTKKSLLASGLVLLVCAALLMGTTFAWFTDSITNSGNQVDSGELNVSTIAYYWDPQAGTWENNVQFNFDSNAVIQETNWEPGQYNAVLIRVGNYHESDDQAVAAKVALHFNITSKENPDNLSDALWYKLTSFGPVSDAHANSAVNYDANLSYNNPDSRPATGDSNVTCMSAIEKDATAPVTIYPDYYQGQYVYYLLEYGMYTDADDQYQGGTFSLDIGVTATQAPAETDGFNNNQYDNIDFTPVATEEKLQNVAKTGGNVILTQDIALTQRLDVEKDLTIVGDNKTITAPADDDRVLNVQNANTPVTITLSGVNLQGPTSGSYTRGISFYNNSAKVTLVMDGCTASANYYALNVASNTPNMDLIIRNSTITGWCAFQTHSPNVNVTFDNCTLVGQNDMPYNAAGSNNFSTIVVNAGSDGNNDPNGAHDCTLTFRNCRIEANQTTGNQQFLFSIRTINTTVNVENCTFYVDGQQIPATEEGLAPYINFYINPDAEKTFTLNLS